MKRMYVCVSLKLFVAVSEHLSVCVRVCVVCMFVCESKQLINYSFKELITDRLLIIRKQSVTPLVIHACLSLNISTSIYMLDSVPVI